MGVHQRRAYAWKVVDQFLDAHRVPAPLGWRTGITLYDAVSTPIETLRGLATVMRNGFSRSDKACVEFAKAFCHGDRPALAKNPSWAC